MVILVTGASGQLGQSIQFIAKDYPEIQFLFFSSSDLDISNSEQCQTIFAQYKPNFCINAAAYTAVDKAESEPEKAHLINVVGVQNIAKACKTNNCVLLHISTDFVFDGTKNTPYKEEDTTNPLGVYGKTKLDGEKKIQKTLVRYFIIRTSWVYSQFGANFMKTMLRLASERDSITVVDDQIGTPTHAVDLAECLIKIIQYNNLNSTTNNFGIYNFSNEGQCSWYDFAKEIFKVNGIRIDLKPIPTSSYPTPAKRPKYSVMDKSKIIKAFGIHINSWQKSLK
jgi:dTDP-4-dehydrorhamnose reductase